MLVEVVFAEPRRQVVIELNLAAGACVQDALDAAAADSRLHEIDFTDHAVGIYGQPCERSLGLQPGDRVEIYRPLLVDAKAARRQRAQMQLADQHGARPDNQFQPV